MKFEEACRFSGVLSVFFDLFLVLGHVLLRDEVSTSHFDLSSRSILEREKASCREKICVVISDLETSTITHLAFSTV